MIRAHFDGASRGNPGAAGAGMAIYDGERVIWRRASPLGTKTNNEAEYMALGLLVSELERRGLEGVEICGDSKLVISQVTGQWKIKEPRLRALAEPIIARVRALGARCRWVPREQNVEADRMSNAALDRGELIEDLAPASGASVAEERSSGTDDKGAPPELRRAGKKIWIVAEDGEEFAVDLEHGCCTCGDGRRNGRCRHMERVLVENPFAP